MTPASRPSANQVRKRRVRLRRILLGFGQSVILALVLIVGVPLSTVLHSEVAVFRSAAAQLGSRLLTDVFYGELEIATPRKLSLETLELPRVTVRDEQGEAIIQLESVRIELGFWTNLTRWFEAEPKLTLVLPHARIERSLVVITPDAAGEPTLVRALTPRPSSPREKASTEPRRDLRVFFPVLELGRAEAQLHLRGVEEIVPVLSRVRGQLLVTENGVALDVTRLGVNVGGILNRELSGTGELQLRAPGKTQLQFAGLLGDVELQLSSTLEGTELWAKAESRALKPAAARDLFGVWPFQDTLSAAVEVGGVLPQFHTRAQLSTEDATVDVNGELELGSETRGSWNVEINNLSSRSFSSAVPQALLHASAHVDLRQGDSLEIDLTGRTEPTQVAEVSVPALGFELHYRDGDVTGELDVEEPNSPLSVSLTLPEQGAMQADFRIPPFQLEKSRLKEILRLPTGPRGVATVRGTVRMLNKELELSASGQVQKFEFEQLSTSALDFQVYGTAHSDAIRDANVSTKLQVKGFKYAQLKYTSLTASARGNRDSVRASAVLEDPDGRSLEASARIFASGLIRDAKLKARRHGIELLAHVDHLNPKGPELEVSNLSLRGTEATLDGKFRYRPGLVEGELQGEQIDLARVAAVLGLPPHLLKGTLSTRSEVTLGSDVSRARIYLDARNVAIHNWGRGNVTLTATLRDRQLDGTLVGTDQTTGVLFGSTFDLELAGNALETAAWKDATGNAEFAISNVRLEVLNTLLGGKALGDVEGLAGVRARVLRDASDAWPSATVEVGVQDLATTLKFGEQTHLVSDVRVYVSAFFDAGRRKVFGSGSIDDAAGRLLTTSAAFGLDPEAWLRSPEKARQALLAEPLNVLVNVPERSLDRLPLVDPSSMPHGTLDAQLALFGSIAEPRISLLVGGRNLVPRSNPNAAPVTLKLNGQYAVNTGDVESSIIGSSGGRSIVMGKVKGQLPPHALRGEIPWNGSVRIALDHFPLALIPPLVAAQLDGKVTGSLSLVQEQAPELSAHFDLSDVTSGRSRFGNGLLALKGEPGNLLLNFSLGDAHRSLNLKAQATSKPSAQLPLPHEIDSLDATVSARKLNIAVFGPLLDDVVARLHGDIDADVTLLMQRTGSGEEARWSRRIEGNATLERGNAFVDALGLELHDIGAKLAVRPAGQRTLLEFRDVKAKARSEVINFQGSGQILFEGGSVYSGSIGLLLQSVPITLQGLPLGRADGRATATFQKRSGWDVPGPRAGGEYVEANVTLERWHMKASETATRNLIDLKDNPDVIVLQAEPVTTERRDRLPYRVLIDLNRDVRFSFGAITLPITGNAQVDYDGQTRVFGTLRLVPGTRLPVLGKRFDVLSGEVKLDPEHLGNPGISLALASTTPEGNTIYLTLSGSLQEPVLDPPPSELQALIGGGTGTLLTGGVQALGINALLGESLGTVELRVDSTDDEEADTSYAAAVQIGKDLWFEGGYRRGQDTGLNQSANDVFSGTVDYRFHPNWSLKTYMGNAGGGVDLLWQYRY